MEKNLPLWTWPSLSSVNPENDDDSDYGNIVDNDFLTGSMHFKSHSKSLSSKSIEKRARGPIGASSTKSSPCKGLRKSQENGILRNNQTLGALRNTASFFKKAVLYKWSIFLNSEKKLIIKGYLMGNDQYCNTKPIVKRISSSEVASGTNKYILSGPLAESADDSPPLPNDIREKFLDGFPVDWKELIQTWRDSITNNVSSISIAHQRSIISSKKSLKNVSMERQKNCELSESAVLPGKIQKTPISAEPCIVQKNQSLQKLNSSHLLDIPKMCSSLNEFFQEPWIPLIKEKLLSPECPENVVQSMASTLRFMENLKASSEALNIGEALKTETNNIQGDAYSQVESLDDFVVRFNKSQGYSEKWDPDAAKTTWNVQSENVQNEREETMIERVKRILGKKATDARKKVTANEGKRDKDKGKKPIAVKGGKINKLSVGAVAPKKPIKLERTRTSAKKFSVGNKISGRPMTRSVTRSLQKREISNVVNEKISEKKNEKCILGSFENPLLLSNWRPKLVNECELAVEGTLLDMKNATSNSSHCSDSIQRRINGQLLKTKNGEFIQLIGQFLNQDRYIPEECAHYFLHGFPVNFKAFCKSWQLETKKKVTKSNESNLENSTVTRRSMRGRRILPSLKFWKGQRPGNFEQSIPEKFEESAVGKKRRVDEKSSQENNAPNAPSKKEKIIQVEKKLKSEDEVCLSQRLINRKRKNAQTTQRDEKKQPLIYIDFNSKSDAPEDDDFSL